MILRTYSQIYQHTRHDDNNIMTLTAPLLKEYKKRINLIDNHEQNQK